MSARRHDVVVGLARLVDGLVQQVKEHLSVRGLVGRVRAHVGVEQAQTILRGLWPGCLWRELVALPAQLGDLTVELPNANSLPRVVSV